MTLLPAIPALRNAWCPRCSGAVRKGEEAYEIEGHLWHPECYVSEEGED